MSRGKRITSIREWTWVFGEGVPIAYGHHLNKSDFFVQSLSQSKPFFYFLEDNQLDYITPNHNFGPGNRSLYEKNFNPKQTFGDIWVPPPFKEHYGKLSPVKSEKPILVINNKYNPEWGIQRPFNFLPIEFLLSFFQKFSEKYQIYYIRYNGGKQLDSDEGYYDDVPAYTDEPYDDYEILKQFPNIITIYDFMEKYEKGFNESQLLMMSKAKHILTVNGGNAVLSAYFGDDVMIYGHPTAGSAVRGVWMTDSWLKELSGANIIGHLHWGKMMNDCENRWL